MIGPQFPKCMYLLSLLDQLEVVRIVGDYYRAHGGNEAPGKLLELAIKEARAALEEK